MSDTVKEKVVKQLSEAVKKLKEVKESENTTITKIWIPEFIKTDEEIFKFIELNRYYFGKDNVEFVIVIDDVRYDFKVKE